MSSYYVAEMRSPVSSNGEDWQLVDDKNKHNREFTEEEHQLLSRFQSQGLKGNPFCHVTILPNSGSVLEDERGNATHEDLSFKTEDPIVLPIAEEKTRKEDDDQQHHQTEVASAKDEIVRELRKVRRQNVITHCLLSLLIVVTATWQLSEISIVLALKNKASHPFRAIGSLISGSLLGGGSSKVEDNKFPLAPIIDHLEMPQLPPIGVPQLLNVDMHVTSMITKDVTNND